MCVEYCVATVGGFWVQLSLPHPNPFSSRSAEANKSIKFAHSSRRSPSSDGDSLGESSVPSETPLPMLAVVRAVRNLPEKLAELAHNVRDGKERLLQISDKLRNASVLDPSNVRSHVPHIIGLLGDNGRGKSTLLNTFMRLDVCDPSDYDERHCHESDAIHRFGAAGYVQCVCVCVGGGEGKKARPFRNSC